MTARCMASCAEFDIVLQLTAWSAKMCFSGVASWQWAIASHKF